MTDDINCDEYFLYNCGVKLAIADFLDVKYWQRRVEKLRLHFAMVLL